jgi:hypothetical protein
MVIVKEREFQLSLRRVLIVVGRVLIVVDQNGNALEQGSLQAPRQNAEQAESTLNDPFRNDVD